MELKWMHYYYSKLRNVESNFTILKKKKQQTVNECKYNKYGIKERKEWEIKCIGHVLNYVHCAFIKLCCSWCIY